MAKKLLLTLIIAIIVPVVALAEVKLNLKYPTFGPFNPEQNQSLGAVIGYLYYFIVGIAGLAAFVMLVWGGVQWLVSGAIPNQASEARDKVRNAIIGLLLVLASFLVIQVINPELTIINLDLLSLGDWQDLRPWLFTGELYGRAEYRCQQLGGVSNNYECTGKLPVVEQGSIDAGEQCIVTQSGDSSGNCPSTCRSQGGESAKLVTKIGDDKGIWYCCNATSPGNCSAGGEDFTFAQTTDRKPVSQSVMRAEFGVYGCDDDGCLTAWRKFLQDTSDVENDPIFDSSPEGDTLEGQIGSLWIHGPFVAVLYQNEDYGGERMCFKGWENKDGTTTYPSPPGRLINRLDDFDGWGNETDSIRILQEGDPEIDTLCSKFEERPP